MKAVAQQSTDSPSKQTYKKDRTEEEDKVENDMYIVVVPVTDKADTVSIENGTDAIVRIVNKSNYHEAYLFVKMLKGMG